MGYWGNEWFISCCRNRGVWGRYYGFHIQPILHDVSRSLWNLLLFVFILSLHRSVQNQVHHGYRRQSFCQLLDLPFVQVPFPQLRIVINVDFHIAKEYRKSILSLRDMTRILLDLRTLYKRVDHNGLSQKLHFVDEFLVDKGKQILGRSRSVNLTGNQETPSTIQSSKCMDFFKYSPKGSTRRVSRHSPTVGWGYYQIVSAVPVVLLRA